MKICRHVWRGDLILFYTPPMLQFAGSVVTGGVGDSAGSAGSVLTWRYKLVTIPAAPDSSSMVLWSPTLPLPLCPAMFMSCEAA